MASTPHILALLRLDSLVPATLLTCSLACPNSIQAWALQEAKARMEARGESVEYKPSQ